MTTANQSEVAQYNIFELELAADDRYANPFMDVEVTAEFVSPSGKRYLAYGFYDGRNADQAGIWRVRFAPNEAGEWQYAVSASDPSNAGLHGAAGQFVCAASSAKGFIRVDPDNQYYFSYSDGKPFYGMGDTCYGMVNCITDRQRLHYLDVRSSQKFNFVRFFVSGYPKYAHPELDEADCLPWGGTLEQPDYERYNPRFFRRLESILGELAERGMYAEMEVFNLYLMEPQHGKHSAWFYPSERHENWLKYVVSRFSAYSSVFLWTVTNEYTLYPDGIYRYDGPSDDDWAKRMGALMHKYDPHKHPTTVHPETVRFTGHVFGAGDEIDVLTHQQNSYSSAKWIPEPAPGYMDGFGAEAGKDIAADRWYNKPVINTENGYEWLEGFGTNYDYQLHGTDKCRRTAWRIFAAGGAAYAAGFAGTWPGRDGGTWNNRKENKVDGPLPFTVMDMGLAAQLGHYIDFIHQTNFIDMNPASELVNRWTMCLADIGREYIVYAPNGGDIMLNLTDAAGEFTVEWFDPRSGEYSNREVVQGGATYTWAAPDKEDWVVYIKLVEAVAG